MGEETEGALHTHVLNPSGGTDLGPDKEIFLACWMALGYEMSVVQRDDRRAFFTQGACW